MGEKIFVAKESTSQQILAELLGQKPKRYGFRVKLSEKNPSDRVEYLYDAQGMNPASMNFSAGEFNYGDWADVWFVRKNFPCMVKYTGVVDYQLDPNNYALRADTGEESDAADTTYAGNAMSAIPCVWYKRWTDGDYYYFVACEEQYDNSFYADVHTDKNCIVQPYKYVAMFKGALDEKDVLRSISGMTPDVNHTVAEELNYAEKNGDSWTIREWGVWCLIADLLILMGKSTNSQSVYGTGNTGGDASLETGTLKDKGQFFGSSANNSAVKVFHMENWWGDRWDRIVGMIVDSGTVKAKMSGGTDGYNPDGANYETVGAILPTGGYQVREYSGRLGTFPTLATGGATTTYECDSFSVSTSGVVFPTVGGSFSHGSGSGVRCLRCNASASTRSLEIGASLSLKNPC